MDVKPGYKQTEVGVIPEDWVVVSIGSLASFTSGSCISVMALHQQSSDYLIPVYGGNGIAGYTNRPLVQIPVIVVGRVGQKCGEVYLTRGPAWITDNALYPKSISRTVDIRFLALALKGAGLNDVKNRNDLPLLTQAILHSVRFPLPSTKAEQENIAATLSDVDALITALDRLIAKKRDIKQAAMQELLTGKRRLPGFADRNGYKQTEIGVILVDWDVRRLGEVVEFLDGRRRPVKDSDRARMQGDYPYYGASGIVDHVNDFIFDEDLILLGEDGENILSRNCRLAFRVSGKIWVNNHAHVLKPMPGINIDYLTEYLESLDYEQYNTGTAQPKLNKQVCANIPVLCPKEEEQRAIASSLSDMDAEIAAFEARREKTRSLKQGMMQELLTGRIRLVQGGTA